MTKELNKAPPFKDAMQLLLSLLSINSMKFQEEVAAAVKATQGSAETGKSTQIVTEELNRVPAIEHAPVIGNSSQTVTAEFNRAPEIEKVTGGKAPVILVPQSSSLTGRKIHKYPYRLTCALSVCYGKHPCSLHTWIKFHEVVCTQIVYCSFIRVWTV